MKTLNNKLAEVLETTEGKNGICAYISLDGNEAQWYTSPVFFSIFGIELQSFLKQQ